MSIITRGYGSNNLITQGYGGYLQVIAQVVYNGGGSYLENFNNLTKPDKERFITLTCIIKGQEYTQTVKKSNKKINITTEDINLVVNKVLTEMKISIEDLKKYK